MIETPRSILPPPQGAGSPNHGGAGQARLGAIGLPVPVVTPVPPAPTRDSRDEASLPDWRRPARATTAFEDDGEARADSGRDAGRQPRIAFFDGRNIGGPSGRLAGATGSAAFLTQQIFQEGMSAGLHLEPWSQGIVAYRRAGAEPPLESAIPAVFSLAI